MIASMQEARSALEAAGLLVSNNSLPGLLIAPYFVDGGDGLRIYQDGCGLNQMNGDGEWVVLFPAEGIQQYEIPGTLAEGVSLILSAYADHRQNGGCFKDACKRVLKDADQSLGGRALAGV